MIVVTDTSVVLNLCFLHQEWLMEELFGTVLAPPSVKVEFQRLARADARFIGLTFPSFIQVVAPVGIGPSLSGNQRLHRGETDALALAAERRAQAVLMDERAGRNAAADLGLRCIGVLGILIQAKRQGLVPALRPLLDELQAGALFWISPALRAQVLRCANE